MGYVGFNPNNVIYDYCLLFSEYKSDAEGVCPLVSMLNGAEGSSVLTELTSYNIKSDYAYFSIL